MVASGIKLPSSNEAESPREVIEHQIRSVRRLRTIIQGMFATFLNERLDNEKWSITQPKMTDWIELRHNALMHGMAR